MFLDDETYKKLLEMVKNNRRKMLKQKLSKEERSEIAKKAWTPERRQKRSDYMKTRWENNDVHLGYRESYSLTTYKLTNIKTKEETILYGQKEICEFLNYKSLSGVKKQKTYPETVYNRITKEEYNIEEFKEYKFKK